MPTMYELLASTVRTVSDRIVLTIEADTYSKAILKAESVLDKYPLPHDQEGVSCVQIEHRDYGEVHIMDIHEFVTEDNEVEY